MPPTCLADVGDSIPDVEQLEDVLSEPTPGVVETLGGLDGDLIVLGVGGKMGPTLARMARRAYDAAGVRAAGLRRGPVRAAGLADAARRATASSRSVAICSTPRLSTGCPTLPTSSSWPP